MFWLRFISDETLEFVVFNIIIFGCIGLLISFVGAMIPPLRPYRPAINLVSFILLIVGSYFQGGFNKEKEYHERIVEMQKKIDAAHERSKHENERIDKEVNDRVNKLYKGIPVAKFYPTINRSVAELFHIFNILSLQGSEYISFDPTDYMGVVTCGGHSIMGVTTVKLDNINSSDESYVSNAIRTNLDKTLLASGFDLTTAKVAAAAVVGGRSMFENVGGLREAIEYGFDALASITGSTVHRGIYQDDIEKLRVYTIIGGLKRPQQRYSDLRSLAGQEYP